MAVMNWQKIITDIKAALGITQAQLAERIGVAQASISDLERGIVKDPRYSTGAALWSLYQGAVLRGTTPKATQSTSPASSAPV